MLKVKILQVKMSHKFHPPHRLTGFWVFVCSRRIQQYHLRPWYGMLILMQTWWHFLATGTLFEKSYVPVEDSSLLCAQVCSLPNRYLRVDVIPKSHACHKTFLCPVVSSHVVATHCDFGAPTHYSSFAVCNGKASKKTGKRRRQLPNQSQEADQINTHRKTSHDQSQLSRNASQQIETGNRRTNAWEKPSMLQMPLKLCEARCSVLQTPVCCLLIIALLKDLLRAISVHGLGATGWQLGLVMSSWIGSQSRRAVLFHFNPPDVWTGNTTIAGLNVFSKRKCHLKSLPSLRFGISECVAIHTEPPSTANGQATIRGGGRSWWWSCSVCELRLVLAKWVQEFRVRFQVERLIKNTGHSLPLFAFSVGLNWSR